ncbi:MAG: sulfatase-like hydrolase/transferase [Kofleriaceae bacterium]|nr:sulfatase-like hydrolase/transferase [Kofleriaceae bacterium]
MSSAIFVIAENDTYLLLRSPDPRSSKRVILWRIVVDGWLMTTKYSAWVWVMACCVIGCALVSCDWRDDLDGTRRTPEGISNTHQPLPNSNPLVATGPSVEPDSARIVDLFAARPMLDGYRNGGLVIDVGSPAFVKYIDGGIRNDWKRGVSVEDSKGVRLAASLVRGLAAELYFPFDQDEGGISAGEALTIRFRARSAIPKQLVSVFLNEKKISDLSMSSADWQSYSISAPAQHLVSGDNRLRFYFRSAGDLAGIRSAAAFSQFVIGASISEEPAYSKKMTGPSGHRQLALTTSGESRLSYFVKVPDTLAHLRLQVSGKGRYSVRIRGESDRESFEKISGKASEMWREVDIPLRDYRDQIVRIDLNANGAVAWSQIQIQGRVSPRSERKWQAPTRIILWSVSSLRHEAAQSARAAGYSKFIGSNFSIPGIQASAPSAGGSHASAMSGRFRVRGSIPEAWPTLAEQLQSNGYATALISGNGFVTDTTGHSQGFSYYDNPMKRQHHHGASTLWRSAKRYLLQHQKQRVFVHIATVEAHVPYRPSEESLAREWAGAPLFSAARTLSLAAQLLQAKRPASTREMSYIRALYYACVADSSNAFGDMLAELEELHLEGRTAIILAGDHGEELWERDTYGHGESLY